MYIYCIWGELMLRFIDAPYLTSKTIKKIDRIKKNIEAGKYISPVCIVTFASCSEDVFDIIPIITFKTSKKLYSDLLVIGVAENKKAAVKMCASLSNEYMKSKSKLSMREYFYNILNQ